MKGMYSVIREFTGFTTGELLELQAPTNNSIEVYKAWVTENNVTTAEQMNVSVKRTTVVGSGGTDVTPKALEENDQAAPTGTKGHHGGTPTLVADPPLYQESDPNTAGWRFLPTPEERITITGGSSLVLTMENTITSSNGEVGFLFRVL